MSEGGSRAGRAIAIFGPTGVGKTGVAIELADLLRERGEEPVAVSCDAIQLYRGLELLSGAPTSGEQERLEHRLVSIAEPGEEFSAGRFAELAREQIDGLLESGRTPIVVGGTGLYMRAALAELELRPPVPREVRDLVERQVAELGPAAMHAELDADIAQRVHPNDRKRVARALELQRVGLDPPERGRELWTARLRRPTALVGVVVGREELAGRIDRRIDEMLAAGAAEQVLEVERAGPSRTARAALGFEELLRGDVEGMKSAHRRYARRQMTWLRKMADLEVVDRGGLDDRAAAERVRAAIDRDLPADP